MNNNPDNSSKTPILVLIRDGWGYRPDKNFNGPFNGNTPITDKIMDKYPNTLINASGQAVGLPEGYMGNSEVGHMTIGSGRIIFQSLARINKSISDGDFFDIIEFRNAINNVKKNNSKLHLMGLLQIAGVHAHLDHCVALLKLAKQEGLLGDQVLIHIFTDGRDSEVNDSKIHIGTLQNKINELGIGKIVTIIGRYYAMDRDQRWDRTKIAYDAIVNAKPLEDGKVDSVFVDANKIIQKCYDNEETDEFIKPKILEGYNGIQENDSIIFYNFRTDRPRQLTQAIIEDDFIGWKRNSLNVNYVCMTDYYNPISKKASIAFKPNSFNNLLGKVLANNNKQQLRISETEKYAHVTFFFNGQMEKAFKNEDRELIHSPKVATYDLKPEMSVDKVANKIVEKLDENKYDVIIANFVNGDMVGHTGNWDAVLRAIKAVDENVGKVVDKVLGKNGTILMFADHGNCEEMEGKYKTSHTCNQVPFILISNSKLFSKDNCKLKKDKGLQDIAPTVLKLLNIEKPDEMTGECIFETKHI